MRDTRNPGPSENQASLRFLVFDSSEKIQNIFEKDLKNVWKVKEKVLKMKKIADTVLLLKC